MVLVHGYFITEHRIGRTDSTKTVYNLDLAKDTHLFSLNVPIRRLWLLIFALRQIITIYLSLIHMSLADNTVHLAREHIT